MLLKCCRTLYKNTIKDMKRRFSFNCDLDVSFCWFWILIDFRTTYLLKAENAFKLSEIRAIRNFTLDLGALVSIHITSFITPIKFIHYLIIIWMLLSSLSKIFSPGNSLHSSIFLLPPGIYHIYHFILIQKENYLKKPLHFRGNVL